MDSNLSKTSTSRRYFFGNTDDTLSCLMINQVSLAFNKAKEDITIKYKIDDIVHLTRIELRQILILDFREFHFLIQLIKPKDYKKMPWKNGKALTSQITIEPTESSLAKLDFQYRLSSAPIKENCVFSKFPGYCRILLPIKKGFSLNGKLYEIHEAAHFSGDEETNCEPTDDGLVDLGLIYSPNSYSVHLKVLNFKNTVFFNNDKTSIILVYVLRGSLSINDIIGTEDETFVVKQVEGLTFNSEKNTTIAFFKLEPAI